jgi:hypothetical protein
MFFEKKWRHMIMNQFISGNTVYEYSFCRHEHEKSKKRRSPMIFWTDCHWLPIEVSYFPCSQIKQLNRRDFFHVNNLTESRKCLFLSCFFSRCTDSHGFWKYLHQERGRGIHQEKMVLLSRLINLITVNVRARTKYHIVLDLHMPLPQESLMRIIRDSCGN